MTHGRTLALAGVGLLCVLAASRAELPKPQPAPPELPVLPPRPGGAVPSPLDAVRQPPSLPPLPPPLPSPVPPTPAVEPRVRPAASPSPAEPAITEPVATVHRFNGRYLGGDAKRALVYVETGDGKAEVQSRPLADAIPPADAGAKDDVKRLEVPAGEVTWHNGRVFLSTKRELWVLDGEGRLDWKFVLPGRADNGERVLGVAGFDTGNVLLACQYDAKPGAADGPSGRVLGLDVASGRQVRFVTVEGAFDADARLHLDASGQMLYTVGATRVAGYPLNAPVVGATTLPFPAMPARHLRSNAGAVIATTPGGVGMTHKGAVVVLLPDHVGTAPAAPTGRDGSPFYAPVRSPAGEFSLAAVDPWGTKTPAWSVRVSREIAAAPVLCGPSVYFVAGNTAYRVNATDGAVCWKLTLPLKPGESLTDLVFADGELRASGPGVLVRVSERAEPKAPQLFGSWLGVVPAH